MAKKKADTSVGFVEPSMTLILGVKEGEWKELKQFRDEGIFYQTGTSFVTFAASLFITLVTAGIENKKTENILWAVFGSALGIGFLLLFIWYRENKKKSNVVKKVEGRAIEQYGSSVDL